MTDIDDFSKPLPKASPAAVLNNNIRELKLEAHRNYYELKELQDKIEFASKSKEYILTAIKEYEKVVLELGEDLRKWNSPNKDFPSDYFD